MHLPLFGFWSRLTEDNLSFQPYNTEHITVIILFLSSIFILIPYARKNWDETKQIRFAVTLCAIAAFWQLFKVFVRLYLGNFDHTEDLPLQLCNILPFFMWYTFHKRNRWLFGILFFWIMAGTFQAMITPTFVDGFPHYESIRYWVVHAGLSFLALYGVFVLRWHLNLWDAIRSMIGMNVLALAMLPVNLLLNSNYLYLFDKPPGKTLYDLLGPWPWYILSLEGVIIVLFGILLIPFYLFRRS